ncbi:MAG: ATP-binding protein [Candidatus Omnitrophota bacterium]
MPKHISRVIFNQFVTTKAREFGMRRGFGLGLTFCKLAVEKLGGYIAVSSSQKKGTVFTFTLPLKAKNVAK